MDPDPTTRVTFWPVFIGSILNTMAAVGTAQAHVQRYCSLPTMRQAKMSENFSIAKINNYSIVLVDPYCL